MGLRLRISSPISRNGSPGMPDNYGIEAYPERLHFDIFSRSRPTVIGISGSGITVAAAGEIHFHLHCRHAGQECSTRGVGSVERLSCCFEVRKLRFGVLY